MLNRTKTTRNNPFKRWPLRIKQFSLAHTQGHILPHVFTQNAHYSKFYLICSKKHVHHVCYTNKCVQPHKLQRFSWTTSNSHNALVHEFYLMFVSSETWRTKSNISYPYLTFKEKKCSPFVFHVKSSFYLTFMQNERFTSFTSRIHVLPHSYKRLIFTSYTSLQELTFTHFTSQCVKDFLLLPHTFI